MNTTAKKTGRGGLLNIEFKDKDALYMAYMPFIKNGGLFLQTRHAYEIGDELFLIMMLPDESEKTPAACQVVWITPAGAQSNRKPGIGVQFRDKGLARTKIETHLAGMLTSDKPTFTM